MSGHRVDRRTAARGRPGAVLAAAALALSFAACEDALDVQDREFLTPDAVETDLLVAGAHRDFINAYSGGGLTDRYLSTSALITDELFSSGTFTTRTATDQRTQFPMAQGNTSDLAYVELHQARRAAIRAFDALTADEQGTSPEAAEMKTLEGYTYVALGEGFCSGIPFSDVDEGGDLIAGTPISTSEVFQGAITRFDAALAIDGGNNTARVGKARAQLNLGQVQEAAATVASVPTDFLRLLEHSDNSGDQENPIFNLQSNGRYSLSDVEGGNGLPFRSAMDPRVPWTEDPEGGFDSSIPLFLALQYAQPAGRSAPVVLADGVEARLIEAEAALDAGDPGTMISILNALRADVANLMSARFLNWGDFVGGDTGFPETLPPLSDPGSQEARVDLLFQERGFWMYLTGHRLGDMRRLIRDYGRSASDLYPTGAYFKGGSYGSDIVLPLDFDETNNENYSEDMCSYSTP